VKDHLPLSQHNKSSSNLRGWIIYSRVSTEEQVTGHSLENQLGLCRDWLKKQGLPILTVITDGGASGKNLKRQGMFRIRELVRQGIVDGVVVTKVDRLSRSLWDTLSLVAEFEKNKTELQCVEEPMETRTPGGKLMFQIRSVFAEHERAQISSRQKTSHQYRKKHGYFSGGSIPAGFCSEGSTGKRKLAIDPIWGPIVANLWFLVEEGKSLRDCATYLQTKGVPNRSGGRWSANSVSGILRRSWSRGTLVPSEVHDRVRKLLELRKSPKQARQGGRPPHVRPTPSGNTERVWLLQGIGKCTFCGGALTGTHGTGRLGQKHFYLKCCQRSGHAIGEGQCTAINLPAKSWETAVMKATASLISDSAPILSALARESQAWALQMEPLLARRKQVMGERDEAVNKVRRLVEMASMNDTISRSVAEEVMEWQNRREEADLTLFEIEGEIQQGQLGLSDAEGLISMLKDGLAEMEHATEVETRQILSGLLAWVRLGTTQDGPQPMTLGINVPSSGTYQVEVDEIPNPANPLKQQKTFNHKATPGAIMTPFAPIETSEPAKNCRTPDRDQGFDCTYTMADQSRPYPNRRAGGASRC
jgi:DNA invertase Pin-like site-specific DNA recombinase